MNYKDSIGRFLTQALFFETNNTPDYEPVFTLKDEDHEVNGKVYKSMRRLFLEVGDPTEYKFAMQVLGSWAHWKKLSNNNILKPYINAWREELEILLRAEGLAAIRNTANDPSSKGQLQAAKYLADKGWAEKKRGAPSKAERDGELKKQAQIMDESESDYARLFGQRVN